jgi:hypothetical protein
VLPQSPTRNERCALLCYAAGRMHKELDNRPPVCPQCGAEMVVRQNYAVCLYCRHEEPHQLYDDHCGYFAAKMREQGIDSADKPGRSKPSGVGAVAAIAATAMLTAAVAYAAR